MRMTPRRSLSASNLAISPTRSRVVVPPRYRFRERGEFFLEPPTLFSDIGRGNAGIMGCRDTPTVCQHQFQIGERIGPAILEIEFHLVAQRNQSGIGSRRLGVACQTAGIHACERHRRGQAQAELRLQSGARRGYVADAVTGFIQAQSDARDAVGRQAVLLPQLACRLDRRVRHVAGGVILEEVVADVETARRLGQRVDRVEVGAVRSSETLRALQHVAAAGEAALSQPRREQTVIRGLAGMQRLAHRAEH